MGTGAQRTPDRRPQDMTCVAPVGTHTLRARVDIRGERKRRKKKTKKKKKKKKKKKNQLRAETLFKYRNHDLKT